MPRTRHSPQTDLALADLPVGRRIAITGNRRTTPADERRIAERIATAVADPGVAALLFGGAVGADTVAIEAARAARTGERPVLVLVLPDTLEAQPKMTHEAAAMADRHVELGFPIRPEDRWRAFHRRNRFLVDHATEVIAFWDGSERSGTGATVAYARRRGVPVEVVSIEGTDRPGDEDTARRGATGPEPREPSTDSCPPTTRRGTRAKEG